MSFRLSLAVVVAVPVLVIGCAQDVSLASPSSPPASLISGGAVRTESNVSPVLAQLIVVNNQLVSANRQLTLLFSPGDPVIPPNPISPPLEQNALDFYVKANALLASIPPNPIAPLTDALNGIVEQADITLALIPLNQHPGDPIIPQIITQAQRTKTLVAALQNCGDVCSTP